MLRYLANQGNVKLFKVLAVNNSKKYLPALSRERVNNYTKNMKLIIKIENGIITLILRKTGKMLDETVFPDEHNLSRVLLFKISQLLGKNKLEAEDVKKIEVVSDQGDSYTTTRIAKTVAKTWEYAIKERNGS
ncbi:MAG: hypothetical protein QG620_854 [Patescibacteria group bacterium]|nr:hypothetical protein [Patescibacteria group bacterium]